MVSTLRAAKPPFPWYGGKSRIAAEVWKRFGAVRQYVEPFAGSLAVLLACPHELKSVVVNDLDCHIANFWRATSADAAAVAAHADHPVSEIDLQARLRWMLDRADFKARMLADPLFYDARMTGWWCWGQCASILGNWMSTKGLNAKPDLHPYGHGILADDGIGRIFALRHRLRDVKTLCGDWSRAVSSRALLREVTPCGIFLDPPYSAARATGCYVEDSFDVAARVREWALAHGDDTDLRIAVCGHAGEYELPETWERVVWRAGGMERLGTGRGRESVDKHCIWFSPHCVVADEPVRRPLF